MVRGFSWTPLELQVEEQTAVANGTAGGGGGPVRVGVVFAGRQSAGGHNIIWGLHEYLKGGDNKVSALKFTRSSLMVATMFVRCRCRHIRLHLGSCSHISDLARQVQSGSVCGCLTDPRVVPQKASN